MYHHLLLAKLEALVVSPIICKWVAAYLRERSLRVGVGDQLCLIFINDHPIFITTSCNMFVDDMELISPHMKSIIFWKISGRHSSGSWFGIRDLLFPNLNIYT